MRNLYIIPPPPHLLKIDNASALSLHKKQSSTYQKQHGCRWFQAAASFSSEKLVVGQRTRTYAVQHACGCFLYAPSICIVYFQKKFQDGHGCPWLCTEASFCRAKTRRQQMYTDVRLLAGYLPHLFLKVIKQIKELYFRTSIAHRR